jgi:hypothetical protein
VLRRQRTDNSLPSASSTASPPPACAAGSVSAAGIDLTLPAPAELRVNVFNGTDIAGRELEVYVELGQRRFSMAASGTYANQPADLAALLRYGPAGAGGAWLLRSFIRGELQAEFVPDRTDAAVDVVVGTSYAGLYTTTEVNQRIPAAGHPPTPIGACVDRDWMFG